MKDKKYPVLYATNLMGTLYKHCSIHPTVYFNIRLNEDMLKSDEDYQSYMERIIDECYVNIVNKFTFSQALKVTNNKIPFIIFRGNVDKGMVKQFCRTLLDEVSFSTKASHVADYMMIDTMFMQIGKAPKFYRVNSVGDKLSETDFLSLYGETLESSEKPEDAGWLTTYYDFKRGPAKSEEEQEEIVAW